MKEYTFEADRFYIFYDLRQARKTALEVALKTGGEVLVTMLDRKTFKQNWYTAYPNGKWIENGKGMSFNN